MTRIVSSLSYKVTVGQHQTFEKFVSESGIFIESMKIFKYMFEPDWPEHGPYSTAIVLEPPDPSVSEMYCIADRPSTVIRHANIFELLALGKVQQDLPNDSIIVALGTPAEGDEVDDCYFCIERRGAKWVLIKKDGEMLDSMRERVLLAVVYL